MAEDKLNWTTETTCKLIELYKEHSLLWDVSHEEYKNRFKRADTLKKIGKRLNKSAHEIEKKIKIIKTQYQRENRIKKALKQSGGNVSSRSMWFGYDLMHFLKDKCSVKESKHEAALYDEKSNNTTAEDSILLKEDETQDSDDQVPDTDMDDVRNEDNGPTNTKRRFFHPTTSSKTRLGKRTFDGKRNGPQQNNSQRCDQVFAMLQAVYRERTQQPSPDDFDLYGEIIARKLRKLHTEYAQITVQHLIDNLLYDAQLGKYDDPPYVDYALTSPNLRSAPTEQSATNGYTQEEMFPNELIIKSSPKSN